ncbi:conserved hypothetical protein [Theileria equi strain WA]|uniref:U3 small nucleolar RNA-associated protein 25 n=1 Tax=Theileria equi strain WA TaxID=1537102 RepID=L1LG53_THEEQ|nr:conserved hypothetical protein [Theileria equi strain WA]EKX74240.1 conserved hypothetical protein [Theileria equi strain WA]|eukprot:XP_004833692.1 conserved hypothetical protein [Theileria equi strain WA]
MLNSVTHDEEEESALDKLFKLICKDKNRKRVNPESLECDNFGEFNIPELTEESDAESDVASEITADPLPRDLYESFNDDYETFLSSNAPIVGECFVDHPLFASYKVKSKTPVLERVLKSNAVPDPVENGSYYFISKNLIKKLHKLSKDAENKVDIPQLSNRIRYLFHCINSYLDVLYVDHHTRNLDAVRFVCSLHIANHISKGSIKKLDSTENDGKVDNKDLGNENTHNRSEGFTRPKVLVLCGLRCIAYEIITYLLMLLPPSKSDESLERFENEFSLGEDDLSDQVEMFSKTKKPQDFVNTFSGNQDDAFKVGIRYQSGILHLFTPFYSSDIIVASPLGLRSIVGHKGDGDSDYDFLSSIEIVVCDRIDIIKFQNWRLFSDLWKLINQPLVKWRDGDISKIRMSVIDGQIGEYRQNILVSCSRNAVFNSLFKNGKNKRGSIRLFSPYTSDYILLGSRCKIQQFFIKVPASNIKQANEELLDYFIDNMMDNLHEVKEVLIVLADYTQYYRICKKLKASNLEYLTCHESNTSKQMTFSRQKFYSGSVPILITTFRLLFFKRYLFKGASRIFLLQPPEYAPMYKDLLRMVDPGKNNSIVCYYTLFHTALLEPIVGTSRIAWLIKAPDTHIIQFH